MEDVSDKGRSLSELPEHVLSHILSFLPTKEAVRTSILSKRWEYVWTSIPKLDFVQGDARPMDFVNIIDRSLRLRGSFDVTSFSLKCTCGIDEDWEDLDMMSHIEAWISDVVRFNVQDVFLTWNVQDVELRLLGGAFTLYLPFSFVNCRTLTSLTISGQGIIGVEFPSPVCFSNLKKLQLCGVMFPLEYSTQKLFSGCPMLEDMRLEECDWGDVRAAVSVASQRLQYFSMIEDKGPFALNFNGDEFVIFGGAMKYFRYEGQFQFDFNILNSQLLEVVVINFYSHMTDPMLVKDHFLRLLRSTPNVEKLTLNNASCLLGIPEVWIHLPMFNGLLILMLDYESSDLSNIGLWKMLQNMPCLEYLLFLEGIKVASYPIEDNILNPLPPCFLSHLHYITVVIWTDDAVDLMGVKVLLKNAMVLKKMTVMLSPLVNDDKRNNFCNELLKLPRGSKDCRISL